MKATLNDRKQFPTAGLRAASAVCHDRAISDVTLWRWRKRGWVSCVNISGKCYVDLASLAEFDRRAFAGEFARPPWGAAKKSAEAVLVEAEPAKKKNKN